MDEVLRFAGDYWWVIFPIGGVVGGWARHLANYNEKRRRDKIELARIKANARNDTIRQVSAEQIAKVTKRHDALERGTGT